MRLDVSLQQKLQLQLKLAPQIIQSIEILQLPALDLKDMIEQELLENETLELTDAREEVAPATAEEEREAREKDEYEELYERLERIYEEDGSWEPGPRRPMLTEDGKDRKLEAIQNTAARPPGLQERLIEQLAWASVSERLLPLVRAIIYSLDESGYLLYSLDDVLRVVNANLDGDGTPYAAEEAERALRAVQDLEPRGVGARNLAEALLLQITDDDPNAALKRRVVGEYLEDVNKNRIPKVARELDLSLEVVTALVEEIGRLDPRPGAVLSSEETHYITPDVMIEWEGGDYEIRLEDAYFPALRISPRYLRMLRDHRQDPKVREHIKKKIESARWLIDSIEQRQNTLERVVRAIVARQRDFLDFGISHLKPLKMQEIADELGIHVSTVSRAIAEKHAQTHRGILPLKFFFTGGTEADDGSVESRASVKQKVLAIVEAEDKKAPLSDEEIANRLRDEGLNIARRTVTKYRKQLKIPSSRQRRVWT